MINVKNEFYIWDCKCNSTLFTNSGKKKITLGPVPLLEFSMWGTTVVGRKIKVKIV